MQGQISFGDNAKVTETCLSLTTSLRSRDARKGGK